MAFPVINPILQFFDNSGNVLSGGKLFVYEPGTTTKKNTHSDENLSVLNANPIVLDSAGRCTIFLTDGEEYKFVLAPATDTDPPTSAIRTVDEVKSPSALTAANIGAGLYPRTAAEIAAGVTPVNYSYRAGHVKRYSSTLNSAAIQSALDANAGMAIYLSGDTADTHTVTTALTVPVNTDILVDGDGPAVIDASGASLSGVGLIRCLGSVSASLGGGLSGAVSAGDLSITFANSSHGLAAGDLCVIHNTADGSWNADRADYRQGEFIVIKSVSGATVTLSSALLDSYAGTCVVYKVTSTSTKIIGNIEIRGNTSDTANLPTVYMQYGRGTVIDGVRFKNTTATCIEHSNCFMPTVRNVETGKYLTDAGSIQASGVIFSGCQYALCDHSVLVADRHGASTGGGGLVVDRFNVFERNYIASRTALAADFHGCAEFCAYIENHIDGAVNLSGARNILRSNHIYQHATAGALINWDAARGFENLIENNDFYMRGSSALYVIDANASTDINANTTDGGTFKFSRNRIHDDMARDQTYLFIRNNGSTATMRLEVTENEIIKSNDTYYGAMLSLSVVSGSAFASVLSKGNTYRFTHLGAIAADEVVVSNDTELRSASEAQQTTITIGSSGNCHYEDNYTKGGGKLSITTASGKMAFCAFSSNTRKSLAAAVTVPVSIANAEKVSSDNNTIDGSTATSQTSSISFQNCDDVQGDGDKFYGNGGPDFSLSDGQGHYQCTFEVTKSLATPATSFTLYTVPTNMSVMPLTVQGRTDTVITATTGNFWSVGVDDASRRADYGVCTTSAASSQHAKNAKFRKVVTQNSSTLADSGEVIALMSVDATADTAALASNMGGAGETITVRMTAMFIGNLVDAA